MSNGSEWSAFSKPWVDLEVFIQIGARSVKPVVLKSPGERIKMQLTVPHPQILIQREDCVAVRKEALGRSGLSPRALPPTSRMSLGFTQPLRRSLLTCHVEIRGRMTSGASWELNAGSRVF